jgi:hypothetical protein
MEPESSSSYSQKPSTCPCPEPDQTSSYHHILISLRSILILSTHLCLGLYSGLFISDFPITSYVHCPFSHACYMPCTSHPPWHDDSNYAWGGAQFVKLLIMQFSPASYHFILLRPKYSPQRLFSNILKSILFPWWETPCLTPIQNHRQNYNFVYFIFFAFRQESRRCRVLNRVQNCCNYKITVAQ